MQSDNIIDDLSLPSLDDEVRGGEEHDHGGHHGVDAQPDQAEPVYHHRSELPVGHRQLLLVLLTRPLGQVPAVHGAVMMGVMVMHNIHLNSLRMSLTSCARFMLRLNALLVTGQQWSGGGARARPWWPQWQQERSSSTGPGV